MSGTPSSDEDRQDSVLQDILIDCLDRMEADGPAVIEEICKEHPEYADQIRRKIAKLKEVGLLGADGEASLDPRGAKVPEQLGEFRLLEKIGGGGMGVVYLAEQVGLDRQVAIKLIKPEQLYFAGARERFRREVKTVARLQHPGIVPVHTVGEDQGIPYFVMEYVRGSTLEEVLGRLSGRPPASLVGQEMAEAIVRISRETDPTVVASTASYLFSGDWEQCCLRVVQKVAEALEHAHKRGVLHRDIKPSNIMVTPTGRVMLLDFGLARGGDTSRLTRTGAQLGSVFYMSPEQARGEFESLDARSDVYSLGVTLYELLTLKTAFKRDTAQEVYAAIQEGRATPIRRLNTAISWEAEAVCRTAMDRNPARRYARAADLARDLGNVLEHHPIEARRVGKLRRAHHWVQRHPAASLSLTILLPLVIGVPLGFAFQERSARIRVRAQGELAEARFELALAAVDRMVDRVGRVDLRYAPQMLAIRRALLQDALEIYQEFLESKSDPARRRDTARVLLSTGEIRRRLGEPEQAEHTVREAVAVLKDLAAGQPQNPDLRRDLARAERWLGGLFAETARDAAAVEAYRRAIDCLEQVERSDGALPVDRVEGGRLRVDVAALLLPTDPSGAETECRLGLEILEGVLGAAPEEERAREGRARGQNTLGSVLLATGRPAEAAGALRQAVADYEWLVERFPKNSDYRAGFAATLGSLAVALADEQPEAAEQALRRALRLNRRAVGDFPSLPRFGLDLAAGCVELGLRLYRQGKSDQALELYDEAAALLLDLVTRYPGLPEFGERLEGMLRDWAALEEAQAHARTRRALAEQFARLARTLLAQELPARAAAAAGRLAELTPGSYEGPYRAATLLLECADAVDAQGLADVTAGELRDHALDLLEQAVDRGYEDAADLKANAHFERLRGTPRFAALLERLEEGQ